MDKQIIYLCNGVLLSNKKEQTNNICNKTGESYILSERRETQKNI